MLDTKELENEIKQAKNIEEFVEKHQQELTHQNLQEYLNKKLVEKKLTKAEIITETGLDNSYVYKFFTGAKTKPERDKLLLLAIAMKLTVEETNYLLKYNLQRELYVRDMRDDIVIFGLKNGATCLEVEEALENFKQKPLSAK